MAKAMAVETRDAPPSHLLLKIDSFSLLEKRGLEKYESDDFLAGNSKWRLIIDPNGHVTEEDKDGDDYVSVYLAISGTYSLPENWEVNAVFSIFIFNQISGTYLHTSGKAWRFFALQTKGGCPKFIPKRTFTAPSNGYLVDDNCMFGAEVFVLENRPVTQCLTLKNAKNVPYRRVFEISNFSSIKGIWYSEKFTAGEYEWKLQVFPNGNSDETGRSLSIYLVCVSLQKSSSNERVKATYSVCLKNQLDVFKNHQRTVDYFWFPPNVKHWGHGRHSFVSLASFKKPTGGFLVNDRCLLEIKLLVHDAEK